jgi:hypothetical protein
LGDERWRFTISRNFSRTSRDMSAQVAQESELAISGGSSLTPVQTLPKFWQKIAASAPECADRDSGRFADSITNTLLVEATQAYELPTVFPENANRLEDVNKLAPEAGYLLTAAFPYLTLEQADNILTVTEGPGGGFLDNGSAFGVYSRLDLYRAAEKAMAVAPVRASLH